MSFIESDTNDKAKFKVLIDFKEDSLHFSYFYPKGFPANPGKFSYSAIPRTNGTGASLTNDNKLWESMP